MENLTRNANRKRARFVWEYGLSEKDASIIISQNFSKFMKK